MSAVSMLSFSSTGTPNSGLRDGRRMTIVQRIELTRLASASAFTMQIRVEPGSGFVVGVNSGVVHLDELFDGDEAGLDCLQQIRNRGLDQIQARRS